MSYKHPYKGLPIYRVVEEHYEQYEESFYTTLDIYTTRSSAEAKVERLEMRERVDYLSRESSGSYYYTIEEDVITI